MEPYSFLSGQTSDPRDSPEGKYLIGCRNQLESMSTMFLYEVDFREITKENIDDWTAELRSIVEGIRRRRDEPCTDALLRSCDGAIAILRKVIRNLYVASDLLQRIGARERDTLYQKFEECADLLSHITEDYFK